LIAGAACSYFTTHYTLGSLPFQNVDPQLGMQVRHAD
jgi:hypothetical protein